MELAYKSDTYLKLKVQHHHQQQQSKMMQVMSLPYLLQSLVSTKGATCVQPQSRGIVHHYPSHCNSTIDRSSTAANGARIGYQCAAAASRDQGSYGAPLVQVKKEIKTEGSQTHYSPCPTDAYSQQIRYTLDYRVENHSLRSRPSPSVSKTVMSPDTDSLFPQGSLPLSPLSASNHGSLQSMYYSATEADFSSLYDFPSHSSLDSASYEMYGGSSEDITSPVFTKMVDSNGVSSELLSLEELSNSGMGYNNYLCSGVENGLDQEWLIEPVSLPSPEEQENDIKLPLVSPAPPQSLPLSYQYCSSTVASSPSLLTPEPSLPASPLSTHSYSSEEEELKDVLSFFDDGESSLDMAPAVQPFAPNPLLPVMSPRQVIDVNTPTSSCPILSSPPSPQDQDSDDSCGSIRDWLTRRESSTSLPPPEPQTSARSVSGSTARSRKRKSLPITSSDKQSCAPAPAVKRRMTKGSKKERKKEQNKTAALRYRQKKKEEKSDIEVRRTELEDINHELKVQVNSLSNEINYLKKLWSEVCANKKQPEASNLS